MLPVLQGSVVVVVSSKPNIDTELSFESEASILKIVMETYGVEEEDAQLSFQYQISGIFEFDLAQHIIDNSLDEFLEFFEEELAANLGIHVKDLDVSYNRDSGEIEYFIFSADFEAIENFHVSLQNSALLTELNSVISDVYPDIVIKRIVPNVENNVNLNLVFHS